LSWGQAYPDRYVKGWNSPGRQPHAAAALKCDLRDDPAVKEKLARRSLHPVSYEEGLSVARAIRASRYLGERAVGRALCIVLMGLRMLRQTQQGRAGGDLRSREGRSWQSAQGRGRGERNGQAAVRPARKGLCDPVMYARCVLLSNGERCDVTTAVPRFSPSCRATIFFTVSCWY
jgi:hypothetical protein